jgi:hypothetical protein
MTGRTPTEVRDMGDVRDDVRVGDVRAVREALHAMVRDFDAAVCDGAVAKQFVEEFSQLRRLADAGITLALARVERTGAWAHGGDGVRSTAEWFARRAGVPLGEAIRVADTANRLAAFPTTERAVRDGRLSLPQTHQITDAATEDPSAEDELVDLAARSSFRQLRTRAQQRKAAAQDDAERRARQQRLRGARRWTDDDGMRNYAVKLTSAQAGRFEPIWDRLINDQFVAARREGRRESSEAYAADALVSMAQAMIDETKIAAGPNHGLILVDATALRRGDTEPGERCEIAGIGPIDVATAKQLLGNAIVDILVIDGVDVRTVAHAGRSANRRQKAALLAEWECEIRGCGVQRGLEVDHIEPWADTHHTAIESLGPKCKWHHHLKTNERWRDGPRGDDGKRELFPPTSAGP